MKTITAKWFECAVQYERMNEKGTQKRVTEKYVVDALSFTEAETNIISEVSPFVQGEMAIRGIVPQPYGEIVLSENPEHDRWYKVKVDFITIDEKTSEEKHNNVVYLVQGHTHDDANENVKTLFSNTPIDYEIKSLIETKVMDVFTHDMDKPEGELAPIEVVECTRKNLRIALGRRLVHPVLNIWEETFKDEDTGEDIKVERNEILYSRGDRVTPELWEEIIQRGKKDVALYR